MNTLCQGKYRPAQGLDITAGCCPPPPLPGRSAPLPPRNDREEHPEQVRGHLLKVCPAQREDRIGTGPSRARAQVIHVDLGGNKVISVQTQRP